MEKDNQHSVKTILTTFGDLGKNRLPAGKVLFNPVKNQKMVVILTEMM